MSLCREGSLLVCHVFVLCYMCCVCAVRVTSGCVMCLYYDVCVVRVAGGCFRYVLVCHVFVRMLYVICMCCEALL